MTKASYGGGVEGDSPRWGLVLCGGSGSLAGCKKTTCVPFVVLGFRHDVSFI